MASIGEFGRQFSTGQLASPKFRNAQCGSLASETPDIANQLCKDFGALLLPENRKIGADQAAGNDRRGLVTGEDRFDNIRRQERKRKQFCDRADFHAFAGGELMIQRQPDETDDPTPFALVTTVTMPGVAEVYSQVRARVAVKPRVAVRP